MFSGDCWRGVAEQWRGFAVVFGGEDGHTETRWRKTLRPKKDNNNFFVDLFYCLSSII